MNNVDMDRIILHCDLNNFYASVECILNPDLTDKCIAVCGDVENRHGIVLAKNTNAKLMGVKTGEAVWEAKQKCPDLTIVVPHHNYYASYSMRVRDIYARYTDKIEAFGIDECWLDVTHCKVFGTGREIADKLRAEVKRETGLTISVGVSFNKIYAKLGSDLKKPDATTVIDKYNYKELVYPLPADSLLMIGAKTMQALKRLNINTIGDLAQADEALLSKYFGIVGKQLKQNAKGEDTSQVRNHGNERVIKSVGHGTTTKTNVTDYGVAKQVIFGLSEMVATRLRRYRLKASLVHIDLRYDDLSHNSHQKIVSPPFNSALSIADIAFELLKEIWHGEKKQPIRTITVTASKLQDCEEAEQINLFEKPIKRNEKIEEAVDLVRKKYGYDSIMRAVLLENAVLCDKYCEEEDLLPFKR